MKRYAAGLLLLLPLALVTACGVEPAPSASVRDTMPVRTPGLPTPSTPTGTPWKPPQEQQGKCTKVGTALTVGIVEPALGHRAVGLKLHNCSRRTLTVRGYPVVRLLDKRKHQLPVKVKHGTSYMASDPGPKTFRLKPGQQLISVISWSATVTDPDPAKEQTSTYVTIAPLPGNQPQQFRTDADLGTTGTITLTAWTDKLPS